MSNKDLVSRARAMLTADDVDTKDMLAMVGELADAVERVPCILANRCEAMDAKPAAVKESLTAGEQPAANGLARTLAKFNAWRKGEIHEWNVGTHSGPDPREITEAIDAAVALLAAIQKKGELL